MVSFGYGLKCNLTVVIVVAMVAKFILDHKLPSDGLNSYAKSAIKRAVSEECKKNLTNFAIRNAGEISQILHRTCPKDLVGPNLYRIGCLTDFESGGIFVKERVETESLCCAKCFSYGHSYAGYKLSKKSCQCKDEISFTARHRDCDEFRDAIYYRLNHGIYTPSRNLTKQGSKANKIETVRIVFLLTLSGRSSQQIIRLINSIYSKQHLYYLHVDERDNFLHKDLSTRVNLLNRTNIILAPRRYATIWGGPQLLDMMLDAFDILESYTTWDYLINLSESDFPIKPLKNLEKFLLSYSDKRPIFLKMHTIKGYQFVAKQGLEKHFVQCERRAWLMGTRQLPLGIIYSGGSDWMALPRDFCTYISKRKDKMVVSLVELFKTTLLPVESFFHTLALNGYFCDRLVNNNLRIANWRGKKGCNCQQKVSVDWCGCGPLVFKKDGWTLLNKTKSYSSLFFARKFDPIISLSVINTVESQLVGKRPLREGRSNDSRYWFNLYSHDLDPPNRTLMQFGLFALKQVNESLVENQIELKTVDAFFNQDKFVGWIIVQRLVKSGKLSKILLKRNVKAQIKRYNTGCFDMELKAAEIGHGFDEREQLFRDFLPLNQNSTVAMMIECRTTDLRLKEPVKLIWSNQISGSSFTQNGTLEVGFNNSTRIIYNLNLRAPLATGPWSMIIEWNGIECLNSEFMVMGFESFKRAEIDEASFAHHYPLDSSCTTDDNLDFVSCPQWAMT